MPVGVLWCHEDGAVVHRGGGGVLGALLLAAMLGLLKGQVHIALHGFQILVHPALDWVVCAGCRPALVKEPLGRGLRKVFRLLEDWEHVGRPAELREVGDDRVKEGELRLDEAEEQERVDGFASLSDKVVFLGCRGLEEAVLESLLVADLVEVPGGLLDRMVDLVLKDLVPQVFRRLVREVEPLFWDVLAQLLENPPLENI